jgi:Tfp pilus assembly protein PilV
MDWLLWIAVLLFVLVVLGVGLLGFALVRIAAISDAMSASMAVERERP